MFMVDRVDTVLAGWVNITAFFDNYVCGWMDERAYGLVG